MLFVFFLLILQTIGTNNTFKLIGISAWWADYNIIFTIRLQYFQKTD